MGAGCKFNMSCLARFLIIVDILRAAIFMPILIGVFCGIAHVFIHKKRMTKVYPDDQTNTEHVDFYRNREVMIYCLFIGILICAMDCLMGISLDKILTQKLQKAGNVWNLIYIGGLLVRNGLNYFIWQYEHWLGLNRLEEDMTKITARVLRTLFACEVYYQVVKGIQFLVSICAQWEVTRPTSAKVHAQKNFPRY